PLRLQLRHFALETHDLELLRFHLAVARKGVLRILGELLYPIAQLRRVNVQVLRCLHIGHASVLDQAHSLKLELASKLPSLHDPPPVPSKHLTRCLRNRVQAISQTLPPGGGCPRSCGSGAVRSPRASCASRNGQRRPWDCLASLAPSAARAMGPATAKLTPYAH